MKLVDILARELSEWPDEVNVIQQSLVDNELYGYRNGVYGPQFRRLISERAEDRRDAKVNRAQWQAAVDALTASWRHVHRIPWR